jgi:hypothetical protein
MVCRLVRDCRDFHQYWDAPCQGNSFVPIRLAEVVVIDAAVSLGRITTRLLFLGILILGALLALCLEPKRSIPLNLCLSIAFGVFSFAWLFVLGFSLWGDALSCKDDARGLFVMGVLMFCLGVYSVLTAKKENKTSS